MAEEDKQLYLVYYFGVPNTNLLFENISSNYPSKKISPNGILLHTNEHKAIIYDKITGDDKLGGNVVVIKFDNWWGKLPTEVADWIRSKGITLTSDKGELKK